MSVYPTLYLFENDKKLKHACKKRKIGDLEAFITKFLESAPPEGEEESAPVDEKKPPTAEKKLAEVRGALVQLDRAGMLALLESPHYPYLLVNFYYRYYSC